MSKQIDYIKASKAAKISRQGAGFIDHSDRTLSPAGYPPAREIDRIRPDKRLRSFDISPLIYKQESIEEFRAIVLLAECAKKQAKDSRKVISTRTPVNAATTDKKVGKSREANHQALAGQSLEVAIRTTSVYESRFIVAGAHAPPPLTVFQELSRSRSRIVKVEVKRPSHRHCRGQAKI